MQSNPLPLQDPAKILVYGELDSHCEVCTGTSPVNPRLCDSCQPYNDAKHVFRCMQPPEVIRHRPDIAPRALSFTELARREGCLICGAIATGVKDLSVAKGLDPEKIQVLNGGLNFLPCYAEDSVERETSEWLSRGVRSWGPVSKDRVLKERHPYHSDQSLWQVDSLVYLIVDYDISTEKIKSLYPAGEPWADNVVLFRLRLWYEEWLKYLSDVRQWEEPYMRLDRIRTWLEDCCQNHGPCQETHHPLPPCTRVVDVIDMKVVLLREEYSYVALSYTWCCSDDSFELRSGNLDILGRRGALKCVQLPKVLGDAMHLCKQLGYRYLWIDRLCIIQNSHASKLAQMQAMDRIYSGAKFTVVIATESGGRTGIPGIIGNPRRRSMWNKQYQIHPEGRLVGVNFERIISNSIWNSRGWTYQEWLLSHRLLYVVDDDTYFECPQHVFQESLGYALGSEENRRSVDSDYNPPSITSISSPADYSFCVQQYSARRLTHENDILAALSGVCNALANRFNMKFDFGIPRTDLVAFLLWEPASNVFERRLDCEDIPSWSWAAWRGAVSYDSSTRSGFREWGTLVRFYSKDEQNQLRFLEVEESWFRAAVEFEKVEHMNDLPKGNTRYAWPPQYTNKVWRDCPQNPWTVFSESNLSSADVDLTTVPPAALIFKTMSAKLRLSYSSSPEDSPKQKLGITRNDGQCIGWLMGMNPSWLSEWIDLSSDHEFIVLCAGISSLKPYYYRALPHLLPRLWKLTVMLVKRDSLDNRLCRRIATGSIDAVNWSSCNPSWNTIILI